MEGEDFLKQEPMIFKIIYVIGIISFIVHFNALTIGDNEQSLIFAIIGFGTLVLFLIRLILFAK
ncbi:MAG: hypothetical protein JJE44_09270 [Flavobacteriaceae bacterium]|nr:hypothetical protein [Flavobacteriaceae bacterium]